RVQRAAVRCAAREPGTAIHRARRRVLRPAREADPLRRRAARGAVLRQPPELRVRAHAEPPRGDAESRLFRRRASRMMRGGGNRHAGPSIMKAVTQQERLRTIAAAARRADLPVDPRTFVEHYYAQVGADDLTDDPKLLAAAALDHLEWAGTRRAKTAKVRAFNPTLEQNGWTSPHTVVQMVNDDMPFLVDSSTMTLDGLGHALHVTIHPRFAVERDGRGRLKSIAPPKSADGNARARLESFIHIEISRQTDPDVLRRIETELERTLADVRAAVEDWQPMLERLAEASRELAESRGAPEALRAEACAFLDWLAADHYTLLGYREYRLRRGKDADTLHPVPETGLGILRQHEHVP